ncbi:MAG TPA: hypothetical protein GXZ82_11585 [Firmicutes bacterium]|nr:hypothetical protein [Bacillota bacterium]
MSGRPPGLPCPPEPSRYHDYERRPKPRYHEDDPHDDMERHDEHEAARDRFEPKRCHDDRHLLELKTKLVVSEETFQKVGVIDITAPPGVGFDALTGKTTHRMYLEPIGCPTLKPVVLHDKLVNEGFLRARLVIEDLDPHPCPDVRKQSAIQVVIPFQSIQDIKGICPGDHVQEFTEIEGLLVSATPGICDANGNTAKLTLKAILKVRALITRECVVAVKGKLVQVLPPPCDTQA